MPDNYSGIQTIGGNNAQGVTQSGIPGVYDIQSPFGQTRADFEIVSVTADGACTLWLADDIEQFIAGGSVVGVGANFDSPTRAVPFIFAASATIAYNGLALPSDGRMFLVVIAAGGAGIHGYVTYKWRRPAIDLDFTEAVMRAQQAAAAIVHETGEAIEEGNPGWLGKLRQIPAPWTNPGAPGSPNKPTREQPARLYQNEETARLSPGRPDQPRTKRDRLTRG